MRAGAELNNSIDHLANRLGNVRVQTKKQRKAAREAAASPANVPANGLPTPSTRTGNKTPRVPRMGKIIAVSDGHHQRYVRERRGNTGKDDTNTHRADPRLLKSGKKNRRQKRAASEPAEANYASDDLRRGQLLLDNQPAENNGASVSTPLVVPQALFDAFGTGTPMGEDTPMTGGTPSLDCTPMSE
ncbi:hypothetical protein N7532_001213 [Penicillium argentinense]|uniref:Uncharacterized protein n=1 Tax=Penicillium argentinense TaxID=1131581 RepID=A0A9W9G253_9EURO|nr:uncharacterized protein N7532_001213 [Penicillium argentinense]KAJ5110678.1 hypothetical protein N7532_001213 [Penicillium argentinense]